MSHDGTIGHAPRDDAYTLAHAFASARYRVEFDDGPIEFGVGERVPDIEAALPATQYAFLTAWNPDAERSDDSRNERADAALARRIDAQGAVRRRTWAQDAQGGHREAGWLVAGLAADAIHALGREFRQAGVLVWLRGAPVRLRMLVERPDGDRRELPEVDWVE
ncbi:DUF3293 domain-containing protein [Lysobacter humi (ex Lee et al. 2017)]